ncbi:unnamed protein product [Pleuronectes platessa]|uniref:Coiled-coil domain-containing protein 112 n=1 Tax=Pleuronectes platessa TaxID=8262 RepID=A0A9N7ZD84_PLEPL|nr:unnamed protein product [Pleuronectes platessa]
MASMATARRADKHLQGDTRGSGSGSDGVDHRQKAAQFLREAEKNRRQIEKLEKEISLSVQCRKNGWTDVCRDLEENEKVLEDERRADKMNLQKQLAKIQNGVKKFQRVLIDVNPTPELIERLKEIMSEVEITINALKEEQRSSLLELLKEERTCTQEIAAYEKKIENWSLALKSEPKLHKTPSVKKTKPPDSDLPAEVRALESFLKKTGGPYGGWDQYGHQAFLKVWTKQRGRPAYRKEAKLYLPDKTLEEIEQHEDWHQELINLQDRKREAIQRWKASKHRELQSRIQSQEEAVEAERKEREAKSKQHRAEKERREAAQRLEEWREAKRWKEEQQEEEKRLAEEIQNRRREKEERRRQLEVKLSVEEQLRLRREEKEEQGRRRREEEQKEMGREAAKGIRHFNDRDIHKLEEKLQEKQLRKKEEEERKRRSLRDTSRLTSPTKGLEERVKHVGPPGEGPVLDMSHGAVPPWRQGL